MKNCSEKGEDGVFSNRDLARLLIPLVIEQVLTAFMGTVDTIMVSTISSAAVSGVSLVDSINVLMQYIFAALATGGTIEQPMLAVVGDAPETIVPHGNTPRNRALLGEAAAGVGASIGGTVVNFYITISGNNSNEVYQGILDAEEEAERLLDAYFAKKARLSYA